MSSVAIKGLLSRKLRAVLTALAIVLGVAMVSGSFVLTDSIQKAFHALFVSSYENTDAVVSGKKLVDYSSSGNATVPASLLAKVRALPDVKEATGLITDLSGGVLTAKLYDKHGKIVTGNGNPTFGYGVDPQATRFNPMRLTAGRWAAAGNEVVVDKNAADKYGFEVGDRTKVAVDAGVFPMRVVGIAKYGGLDSLGGATFAVFDVPTAQRLFGLEGRYMTIAVAARDGVTAATARLRAAAARPRDRSGAHRRRRGREGRAGRRRLREVHPLLPRRVRHGRAVRGRLRDLQHALDHCRAADTRACDAADARRLTAPGAALRRARGVRDRAVRFGCRAPRRGSGSPRG